MSAGLKEYVTELGNHGLVVRQKNLPAADVPVLSVTYNSKEAKKNCLFVCKGASFKKEYLESALYAGAAAYVSETDYEIPGAAAVIVNDIRSAMIVIARLYFGVPHERINIIAVTGTKGKTTTCYLLKQIFDAWLDERNEKRAAFLTSVETFDGEKTFPSVNTTPEIFESYGFLTNAADKGLRYAIMEVSSQGLKYGRVAGLKFGTGILLNLSPDHVSPIEHPDLEDYYSSKLGMFAQTGNAVVNLDSDYADEMIRAAALADTAWTYGARQDCDYRISETKSHGGHSYFTVNAEGQSIPFELGLRGVYNIENAAAAILTGRLYGIPFDIMQKALKDVSIPGRGEEFETEDHRISVIVDYAHNEISCRKVISSAKEDWPEKKIISVFGCTGGKALNRREGMGRTISELSDKIYLTADDPGPEDVNDICAEVAGYLGNCEYEIITDRETAVRKAFSDIDSPSVLLLLGKGCETAQKVGKASVFYPSDAVIISECITKYNKEKTGE